MLSEKFIKSYMKKNKKFKIMENNQWDLGFEPDVRFMYFTYLNEEEKISHIILLATNLDKKIHYEFITQNNQTTEETEKIINELKNELKKELSTNPDYMHKEIIEGMDKEKYIEIIMQDEQTHKRMERHINKKKKEELAKAEKEAQENEEKKEQ